jgi:hypothetical protein
MAIERPRWTPERLTQYFVLLHEDASTFVTVLPESKIKDQEPNSIRRPLLEFSSWILVLGFLNLLSVSEI